MSNSNWAEMIARAREAERLRKLASSPTPPLTGTRADTIVFDDNIPEPVIPEAGAWSWNAEQLSAIDLAKTRKSFCLIGAAGTGKTTTEKEIARILVSESLVPPIDVGTKYLQMGLPGIVFTSFTRRAVRNMKRVVSSDLQPHCITLHKLLEYEPNFYDVIDPITGDERKTMRFEPMRNNLRKLPNSLRTIVIDESSMVSTELFLNLLKALPNPDNVQFIFVGDLHQLPPVYGSAVLGFKLLTLPTIELTRIYRQAAKSPIIALAHKIKNGEIIPVTERTITETEQGKVTIHPWKKALSDFDATHTAAIFLKKLVESGNFDEEEDVILCPQEKTTNLAFGTNEFNKVVAQTLGEKRQAIVHEVIAGYIPHYLAEGDRLLVGREDAIIIKITKNARYWGKRPRTASIELDRWGNYKKKIEAEETSGEDFDVDKYLESFTLDTSGPDDEERKQEASHIIECELLDSGAKETLSTAGEINASQFAYCLTVHKSQGSEWNRVFFLTHQSHVVMWNRELLYTAVTRARKELYCIVEPDRGIKSGTLTKAARSPRIKGNTLAEKAEFFKGKAENFEEQVAATRNLPQGNVVAGKYEGEETQAAPVVPTSTKPPVQLVKLGQFVSELFKHEANKKLDSLWERAKIVWGEEKLGAKPELDFDLQRSKTIAIARPSKNQIGLNALWCIAAEDDEFIRKDMLNDSIPHELAHIVNAKYSMPAGKGHDGGWVMAAKLLGMENPQATTSEYPSWAAQYEAIVGAAKEKLKQKAAEQNQELDLSSTAFTNDEES